MQKILILGAGKIGALIALLLFETKDYDVTVADMNFSGEDIQHVIAKRTQLTLQQLDINDQNAVTQFFKHHSFTAVISSLPFFLNVSVAKLAKEYGMHYFDLTEDTGVTTEIKKLAENSTNAFVPQCGLAPGFVGIVAHSLMKQFTEIDEVNLRTGALPQSSTHRLQYALTWSIDGLINEYINPGKAIKDKNLIEVQALEALEHIQIDGLEYEAFNTSGGLGSLAELYVNKVNQMNYKTLRYPGHCDKMHFLLHDLKLNTDRETLKRILENALPKTYHDVVLIYVSISGMKENVYIKEDYVKKIYPQEIADIHWSAIQITTASSLCAVFDLVLQNPQQYSGLVLQEKFGLDEVLGNRFGMYYR